MKNFKKKKIIAGSTRWNRCCGPPREVTENCKPYKFLQLLELTSGKYCSLRKLLRNLLAQKYHLNGIQQFGHPACLVTGSRLIEAAEVFPRPGVCKAKERGENPIVQPEINEVSSQGQDSQEETPAAQPDPCWHQNSPAYFRSQLPRPIPSLRIPGGEREATGCVRLPAARGQGHLQVVHGRAAPALRADYD